MNRELGFGVYGFKLALVKGVVMPIKEATNESMLNTETTGVCGERKFRVQKNHYRTSESQ